MNIYNFVFYVKVHSVLAWKWKACHCAGLPYFSFSADNFISKYTDKNSNNKLYDILPITWYLNTAVQVSIFNCKRNADKKRVVHYIHLQSLDEIPEALWRGGLVCFMKTIVTWLKQLSRLLLMLCVLFFLTIWFKSDHLHRKFMRTISQSDCSIETMMAN